MRSCWNRAIVHRVLILGAAVAVLMLAAAPSLLSKASDLRQALPVLTDAHETAATQSAAQLSPAELAELPTGLTPGSLRARAGAPDHRSTTRLEGIKLECWYYGVADSRGAYQLCFANGHLASKLRYSERGVGSLDTSG
jgi:hypothetical protein